MHGDANVGNNQRLANVDVAAAYFPGQVQFRPTEAMQQLAFG